MPAVFIKELDLKQGVVDVTKLLGEVELDDAKSSGLIDTAAALSRLIGSLVGLPVHPPSLYIDLEGENLSRDGTVSILQIYVLPTRRTYLVDFHTLQDKCFSTRGKNGQTLKKILESRDIPKVFFDVRNDSDALFSHFGIRLAGIQDLQLMELATRSFGRAYVNGLARCIERDGYLSTAESRDWKECKERGLRLFAPERGGSYKVFNERPLSNEIVRYCTQDVQFLPRLWAYYYSKLGPIWRKRVKKVSAQRVAQSQSADYNPHGRHKALAPTGWVYF